MKRWHVITGVIMTVLGGYWHGFVYAPQRWDYLPKGDLGAISMGCFIGYMLFIICVFIYISWMSADHE